MRETLFLSMIQQQFEFLPTHVIGLNFELVRLFIGNPLEDDYDFIFPVFVKEEDFFKIDHSFPYIFIISLSEKIDETFDLIIETINKIGEIEDKEELENRYFIVKEGFTTTQVKSRYIN